MCFVADEAAVTSSVTVPFSSRLPFRREELIEPGDYVRIGPDGIGRRLDLSDNLPDRVKSERGYVRILHIAPERRPNQLMGGDLPVIRRRKYGRVNVRQRIGRLVHADRPQTMRHRRLRSISLCAGPRTGMAAGAA